MAFRTRYRTHERDSLVGIETRLWAQRSGIRFMLWAKDFSRLNSVYIDSEAHPVVTDVLSPLGKVAAAWRPLPSV